MALRSQRPLHCKHDPECASPKLTANLFAHGFALFCFVTVGLETAPGGFFSTCLLL